MALTLVQLLRQIFKNVSNGKTRDGGMEWSTSKCCPISTDCTETQLILDNQLVQQVSEAEYIGFSLYNSGRSDVEDLERVVAAKKRLGIVMKIYHSQSPGMKTKGIWFCR